jgi:hypothetical protein
MTAPHDDLVAVLSIALLAVLAGLWVGLVALGLVTTGEIGVVGSSGHGPGAVAGRMLDALTAPRGPR